jgi:hypothetical protein
MTKKVSFTPNTITYTAHGDEAKKIGASKVGVVVHTKYHGKDLGSLSAHHDVDMHNFKDHPDVHLHSAEHDTSKVHYPEHAQDEFHKHMAAAKNIHDTHGGKMYPATEKHQGEHSHMTTYINKTVDTGEIPHAAGLQKHIKNVYDKESAKVKTDKAKSAKESEAKDHISHIEKNKSHYENLLTMHHHLAQAKNVLVKSLESHEGRYTHHIAGKKSKPEGFVIHHTPASGKTEPTKLVNRAEFAKQNRLKIRK